MVERPGSEGEEFETWKARFDKYFEIKNTEKEEFAHNYAKKLKEKLIKMIIMLLLLLGQEHQLLLELIIGIIY